MVWKYFRLPFGVTGDRIAIPDDTDPDGEVSYEQGYGPDYSADLLTDPDAKNVERNKMNELFYQITGVLQYLQQNGIPEFISTADNGGVAFNYAKDSLVRYNGGGGYQVYRSLTDSNNSLPSNATYWQSALLPPDATYGDMVVTANGTTWTVGNNAITAVKIAANAVETAKINAKAVTLAKMADGTQGGILYYGASGVIAQLAAGTAAYVLKTGGAGQNPAWGQVAESEVTFTDITTNDSSTTKHGYLKKLSNNAAQYMDGTGNWSIPGVTNTTAQSILDTTPSIAAGAAVADTGLSITLNVPSGKSVLINVGIGSVGAAASGMAVFTLTDGSNNVITPAPNTPGSRITGSFGVTPNANSSSTGSGFSFLYTPASPGSNTIKLRWTGVGSTVYLNRSVTDTNSASFVRTISTLSGIVV